jgi:large subunit ribosomal protein L9
MKIILKEDVDSLGTRGSIVTVKDGYARNYLIPRSLAMRFTRGADKILAQEKRRYEVRQVHEKDEALALAEKIQALELTLARRVGDQETLYGSVTTTDVAELIEEKGFKVDKRKILMHTPIKKLGDYEIPIRLHREVTPALRVHVVKEE